MNRAATATQTTSSPLELTYARTFAAPRDKVFAAWTDPAVLARWWGPKSFTVPEASIDLREGGAWMTLMRNPAGGDHKVSGVYKEIVPPSRLVFTWGWENDGVRGHESTVTVEFEEAPEGTLMRFHQGAFENTEQASMHNEGWTSTFECLDDFIAAGALA